MRILIIRKPTNFELHGERVAANVARGLMRSANIDRLKKVHDQHYQSLDLLYDKLEKLGFEFETILRSDAWPTGFQFDMVMTVGGDGTLLSASHQLGEGQKIVGLRSSDASVGFTCASGSNHVDLLLERILSGKQEFVEVSRIGVRVTKVAGDGVREMVPVLNDVLFANCNPAATSRYRIQIGDDSEIQKSSGIWVSTAVGSTAGILAAGGQRLPLGDKSFQYRVRELYRAPNEDPKLTGGLFTPESKRLIIESRNENALIALGGQHGEMLLDFGDQVEFIRGPSLLLALPENASNQ